MPRDVTFYGSSDDNFECDGGKDADEIGSGCATFVIEAYGQQGLQVTGLYASEGHIENAVWSVGIAPLDDDVPLPDWPMKFSADGYTTRLTITIPDDAVVRVASYHAKLREEC